MAKEIKLYTVEEVSEMFHVAKRTVYLWLHDGDIHATKYGKRWLMSQDEIECFISNKESMKGSSK